METGTILIIKFCFLIIIPIGLVRGKKPDCLGNEEPDENLFSDGHYDEIGFVRDTCVELARNLHNTLNIPEATGPCTSLAKIRTSTLWPFCTWNRWTRKGNKTVSNKVMDKALDMMKDFNVNPVYKTYSMTYNQELIKKCVDTAVIRLTISKAADSNSDLIKEIEKLKLTYCQDYIRYLEQEKKKAEEQSQSEAQHLAQLVKDQQKQQEEGEQFHKNDSFGPHEDYGKQITETVDIRLSQNEEHDLNLNYKYALHASVFYEDPRGLSRFLQIGYNVNAKDQHGNTPLHLAVMLGRESCIDILLKSGASVRSKNVAGWNPVEEAVSFGNKDIIKLLWTQHYRELQHDLVDRRKLLIPQLDAIGDFYMELKWELITSVPLVSRFGVLPSDLCKIYKQGRSIRVDSTFFDYEKFKNVRRDTTMLFDGSDPEKPALYFIDHEDRDYGAMGNQQKDAEDIDEEVDKKMCKDIASFDIPTEGITFDRAMSGWLFNKKKKSEMVGSFMADFYTIKGLKLVSRKRREHLSKKQIKQNDENSIVNILAGGYVPLKFPTKTYYIHDSLPPPECKVTWQQYITSKPGEGPVLARELKIEEQVIPYGGEVGITPKFPISIQLLMEILETVAPFKQFSHLREFLKAKMPSPGFPVKFEIPIMLTVSAKYEIHNFEFKKHEEDVCKIPKGYDYFNYSLLPQKN